MAYQCLNLDLSPKVLVGSFKPGIVDSEMQDEMRKASKDDFPQVEFFKKLKTELDDKKSSLSDKATLPDRQRLDTPENVALFTWFLLNETSDEEYPKDDWDIRDDKHFSRWESVDQSS